MCMYTERPRSHCEKQYVTASLLQVCVRVLTRSSATAKSTARPSCLVGVLYDISQEKICWWLLNHFFVIGHESYRIRRNNAKQWPLRCSRSFKVTDFGTNRKPIYDFSYLAPFSSYGWLYVKFSLATRGCCTLTLLLGVIPCEYRHKWYTAEK